MKWEAFKRERITFAELQLWVVEVAEERGPAPNRGGSAICQEGRTPAFTIAGTSVTSPGLPPPSSGPLAVSLWGLVDIPCGLIYEHLPG